MPHFGEITAQMAGMGANLAPQVITPGASPYTYTAPRAGHVYIGGGTVSLVEVGRNGSFVLGGVIAGVLPLSSGDQLRVTYVVAPTTLTFVPGW